LTPYGQALAALDAAAGGGVELRATAAGIEVVRGEPDDALDALLQALCGSGEARHGLTTARALRELLRAPDRAARELLTLPVRYASGLPLPFTLRFERRRLGSVCTTSRHAYAAARAAGERVWLLRELELVAAAAREGRVSPTHLDRWLAAKGRGEWILTPELAGADLPRFDAHPGDMCFGELFDHMGAELVSVELHEPKEAVAA
jgi:hypothetical protein